MSMTKRAFNALAASIRTAHSELPQSGAIIGDPYKCAHAVLDELAENIADLCAKHNSNFQRSKFLDACKGEG